MALASWTSHYAATFPLVPESTLTVSLSSSSSLASPSLHKTLHLRRQPRRRLKPRSLLIAAATPARDMELDFGKYKGKKLGTLPQNYLRWMARSLKKSGAALWAAFAEEVLQDPYYHDRLEWEKLENTLLKGRKREGAGRNLTQESLMRAYGWDLDNRSSWGKVKLSRLGTTEGGRIPRVQAARVCCDSSSSLNMASDVNEILEARALTAKSANKCEGGRVEEDEVMSRRRMRRQRILASDKVEPKSEEKPSLFPGRGTLLRRFSQASGSAP